MTVAEALSNLVFAAITDLRDVKCSGNWMWAAKLPGEGAALYDTCVAMCDIMSQLGIAIDGGKFKLTMEEKTSTRLFIKYLHFLYDFVTKKNAFSIFFFGGNRFYASKYIRTDDFETLITKFFQSI